MKKITLLVISLLAIQTVFATSWRINNKVGIDANFTNLQEANDTSAVQNGDTIYCDNGAFVGSATITKQLFIIGPGYFLTQVDTSYANPSPSSANEITFQTGSDGSTITGMIIMGYIEFYNNNSITIERCKINNIKAGHANYYRQNNIIFRQNYIYGSIVLNGVESIDIYNNIITGIIQLGSVLQATIENNVIIQSSSAHAITTSNCSVINNIICTNGTVYSLSGNNNTFDRNVVVKYPNVNSTLSQTQPSGTNIWGTVTMDSVFVNTGSPDSKYKLASGSPAIGYCLNNRDAGAYEGVYGYVLSGFPRYFPRIYEDLSTGAATSSGIPIHIKAKSQER